MSDITLDVILDELCKIGVIKDKVLKLPILPGHGSCCTCKTCGRFYDDCVCFDNMVIKHMILLFEGNNSERK